MGPWRRGAPSARSPSLRHVPRFLPITEADLPWNCTVTEGQVTNFDLLTGPRPTLVGRLTFDGRGPGAWSAQLMDDADPIVRDNKVRVAADGSFTIEVPSEGRYRLMIRADSEECVLTTEIDLYGSRVDWTRDLPAGAGAGGDTSGPESSVFGRGGRARGAAG